MSSADFFDERAVRIFSDLSAEQTHNEKRRVRLHTAACELHRTPRAYDRVDRAAAGSRFALTRRRRPAYPNEGYGRGVRRLRSPAPFGAPDLGGDGMKVLLQTTIPFVEDDWNIGRFSLLAAELRAAGHDVSERDREPDGRGDDPVLSTLGDADFDQLWLMAVDVGDGLSPNDVRGILQFRERGGGTLTARDHQDLGSSLVGLHSLGIFNHFHSKNVEPDVERRARDDQDNPNISYPNYHSGANGDYQPIRVLDPPHELLRSPQSSDGIIHFFPAHPHEGAVGVPSAISFARVIAQGRSIVTGRHFNLAVAVDGEPCETRTGAMGRGIAESTFHHFADLNWNVEKGAPSFVTDKPGSEMSRDPGRLHIFKDYVRNAARWLGGGVRAQS